MSIDTLSAALEREHRQIDRGIQEFLSLRARGRTELEPLSRAIHALRRHIFLEETFLFPPLRAAGLVAPIFVMLREHGEIWDTIGAAEAELAADPAGGAADVLCQLLLSQLEQHNAKEEAIIYPQAGALLSDATDAALREFLDSGEIRAGWVCAKASGALAH